MGGIDVPVVYDSCMILQMCGVLSDFELDDRKGFRENIWGI